MAKYYLAWGQEYKKKPKLLTTILDTNPKHVLNQSAYHFKKNPLYEYTDVITINDNQLLKHAIILHKMNIIQKIPLYIGFYFNYKTHEYEIDSNAIHNHYDNVINILQSDLLIYDIGHRVLKDLTTDISYFELTYREIDELSILCDKIK